MTSAKSWIEPASVMSHFSRHSSALRGESPTVTTHRSTPAPHASADSMAAMCSRPVGELSPRATTTAPVARAVRSAATESAVIRPASTITAISVSEMARNSPARSSHHRTISRAPVGLDVDGMTCRLLNRTSWEWSMRLPPLTVRPDATNEAEPGVNWMPKWWLSDPPLESASISSTSVPVDAHWAARYMAVVDAPGEPCAL